MPPDLTAAQSALLAWGEEHLRDLPWRATRDPWAILVAEVMLGQTQVERVIPRWTAFLERWPTVRELAATPLSDLLTFWQGLGYPRRAARLHQAATDMADLGGSVPGTLEALLQLPGVGAYTARAVLAFAHEEDVGVVDTNIARVLARHRGVRLTPSGAQLAADAWVPAGAGWAWNQTLMDLGATVCRPVPRCSACPLAPTCTWSTAGRPEPDPAEGSAGVSRRQAPYEGSDRQARGRILAALGAGPLPAPELAAVIGSVGARDASKAVTLAEGLVADGLVRRDGDRYALG